ncbi:MAG: DUF2075 domain-containing protein, partial [Spirochaetia bacterium]|nr:DUF2075 domain-containing protein [Spirochaetia bacterium]
MLVYTGDKRDFLNDVLHGKIETKIESLLKERMNKGVGQSEKKSWQNSMQYMHMILSDEEIPSDSGVAIEFTIPMSSKRVDFILTGLDEKSKNQAVIIELKQWSEVHPIPNISALLEAGYKGMENKVETFLGRSLTTTVHPSYQAWSYKTLISDFNANIEDIPINLKPCAYLHNYERKEIDDPLFLPHFNSFIEEAPVFCKNDAIKLQSFIKRYIKKGDGKQTLYFIENGTIRPSKSLQDCLVTMLKHNKREFTLIDEQEIVFQKVLHASKQSMIDSRKRVCIIKGGPGTGKTVVAINLLVSLINLGQIATYVTKNSAPRYVFEAKLKQGTMKKRNISNLFKSSGAFIDSVENEFGTILIDEAHRLNRRTSLGPVTKGEDQIKEIIKTGQCSVFFIDEAQKVTAKDYGSIETIKKWALALGAEIIEDELLSQFRCNGSDGYLAWLDNTLGIRETANITLDDIDYDFQVFDDVVKLKHIITEKNAIDGKARLLAGYCWQWDTKNSSKAEIDIEIGDFSMKWNLSGDKTFAISEGSINQVGCIHTTQGLEFSYVGVIIGDDMRFENGKIITDFSKRAKSDKSLHGLLGPARKDDKEALKEIDKIIRNTYRTLMTRGMKGCYLYCTDKNLAEHLKQSISKPPV